MENIVKRSGESKMEYKCNEIEKKWQEYWKKNETFKTDVWDFSKPKYYVLDMFPYPSGVGLHAGHVEGYTATDIVSRMKRMQGFNVLHPMGYDSFGLPAEQYAVQTGNHPNGFTEENIKYFSEQLNTLGFDYDWTKMIATSDPAYYKWTQWIFSQLYKDGYAKYVDMPVNWCEELGTVLSNDEVIDGKSERGGFPVVRKNMKQLCIDQPAFAERLLEGLEEIDWPESTKEMQRNWIGKSIGAHVTFKVDGFDKEFTVFTTRCDTLFGATYCVLAPEHEFVDEITSADKKEEVAAYKKACASKSDLERTELNKDKTGVFIGAYAINPVNETKIPIYISDYVLASYGTGAIMAVPAHDERDYEFAKKFDIPIIEVLKGGDITKEAFVGDGVHVNSGFLDGLGKEEAIAKMTEWLEERGIGSRKVNYKFREWIFARQRYWGEPVPIVHMEDGTDMLLEDEELPLTEYFITVYKEPSIAKKYTSLEEILAEEKLEEHVYFVTSDSSIKITKEVLKKINENKKDFYYNFINEENTILYQLIIPTGTYTDEIDPSFVMEIDNPLTYTGKLPSGISVMLYAGNLYGDETELQVYTYDELGAYTELTTALKVVNGYLNFTTNGEKSYVFSNQNLMGNSSFDLMSNLPMIIFGGLIIFLIAYIVIKKKKGKKEVKSNEPLY